MASGQPCSYCDLGTPLYVQDVVTEKQPKTRTPFSYTNVKTTLEIGARFRLLNVDEVAEMLGMSAAWVRQHANGLRRPLLPSVKLGKSVRFRPERVLEFIESMERVA